MPGRVCKEIICNQKLTASNTLINADLLQAALEMAGDKIPPAEVESVRLSLLKLHEVQLDCPEKLAAIAKKYADLILT